MAIVKILFSKPYPVLEGNRWIAPYICKILYPFDDPNFEAPIQGLWFDVFCRVSLKKRPDYVAEHIHYHLTAAEVNPPQALKENLIPFFAHWPKTEHMPPELAVEAERRDFERISETVQKAFAAIGADRKILYVYYYYDKMVENLPE